MRLESSFIQIEGIGEVTERRLWEQGVAHWRAARNASPLRRDQQTALERHLDEAIDAVEAGRPTFFAERLPTRETWRLTQTFRSGCVALDIETTGLDKRHHDVTTVSFADPDGTETLVRGDDLTADRLTERFADAGVVVTYNGAQFDLPFLETAFDIDIDVPHVDLRYPCRRLGLTGGLSAVEHALGIERALPDVDGREAVELWHRYEAGDTAALDRLVRYNQEDTRNLLPVLDAVHERLDREIFAPHLPAEQVRLDELE